MLGRNETRTRERKCCTCINSENILKFTISISHKLWNNSMGFQCWPTHKNIAKKAIRFIYNAKYNSHTTPMFKNLQLLQAVDIFKLACFKFFYKCENRIIPDYFKNMFLTHEHKRDYNVSHNTLIKWKLIFQTTITMKLR